MTKQDPKKKLQVPTRTARPKGDMFKNLRRPEEVESLTLEEIVADRNTSLSTGATGTSSTSTSSTSTTTSTSPVSARLPGSEISPSRDFQKVPNSITRQAIPAGLFTGKGKQIYDFLYSKTRGAIVPRMSARIPMKEVMRGAGIGSEITLRSNIARLVAAGLIGYERLTGEHGGSEYTVYLPEEAAAGSTSTTSGASGTSTSSGTDMSQNLVPVVGVETSTTSTSLSPTESISSGDSKTSYKTKDRSDDEAFAKLRSAAKELTGKQPSDWSELEDVLVAELKIAAARTTVSSVPAFLAEHLRRRLWKIDRRQARAEGKELPDSAPAQAGQAPHDCPDCKGAGWWYPQGQEKGVAKCRHERLASS